MKVVLSKFDHFYLDVNIADFVEMCIELNNSNKYDPKYKLTITENFEDKDNYTFFKNIHDCIFVSNEDNKDFRTNPYIIEIIENLNEKYKRQVDIIEIPFETIEGWHIERNNDREWIAEDHKIWQFTEEEYQNRCDDEDI